MTLTTILTSEGAIFHILSVNLGDKRLTAKADNGNSLMKRHQNLCMSTWRNSQGPSGQGTMSIMYPNA